MADTRLTKISFWRAIFLVLIAAVAPNRFIREQEKDDEERKKFPESPPHKEHNIMIVRRAFWSSLLLVIASSLLGYGIGFIIDSFSGCVGKRLINPFQIIGVLLLLWATLFVRGWDIQTYGGVTLTERVNRWIFRTLYCIGTGLIISSFALSGC
jgi:nitric oxide reductase large subunit